MSGYLVDTDSLRDIVDRLEQFAGRAASLGDDLDSAVRRLHGQWDGAAADTHRAAHQRWRHAEAELRAAGERLRAAVRVAHANYAEAIAVNRQMWS